MLLRKNTGTRQIFKYTYSYVTMNRVHFIRFNTQMMHKGPVINYGKGCGYNMGKLQMRNLLRPPPPQPPSRQGTTVTFHAPLLNGGNFSRPPFSIAETSNSRVNTTPEPFVPPSPASMAKTFSTPVFVRVKPDSPPPTVL